MPRKKSTCVTNKRAEPKKPDGTVGAHLDPEEKRKKLNVFLQDFDIEMQERLQRIEKDEKKIKSIIEKEIHLQINFLPPEIREMNIMDFIAAGGTAESALMRLEEASNDSFAEMELTKTVRKKKGKGACKAAKVEMVPPSAPIPAAKRSRFKTPNTRQLPAVWDTPAITPKFDTNLPFTPGFARAPKVGERLMSLAGSPVDVTTTLKVKRTLKHTRIAEEDEVDPSLVSLIATEMPGLAKNDINNVLKKFLMLNLPHDKGNK